MSAKRKPPPELDVLLRVDDETLLQLQELEEQHVEHAVVWEESVLAALDADELGSIAVDLDVYVEDGVLFELFGVLCYPGVNSEPLGSSAEIEMTLSAMVAERAWLDEVAVDSEDDLVLVLVDDSERRLYLNAGAWIVGDWEELPK